MQILHTSFLKMSCIKHAMPKISWNYLPGKIFWNRISCRRLRGKDLVLSKYSKCPQRKRIKKKTIKWNKKLYLQIVDFTKNILSFFLWRQSFCATENRLHKGRFFPPPKCNWLLNKLSYLYTISTDWVADTRMCKSI